MSGGLKQYKSQWDYTLIISKKLPVDYNYYVTLEFTYLLDHTIQTMRLKPHYYIGFYSAWIRHYKSM